MTIKLFLQTFKVCRLVLRFLISEQQVKSEPVPVSLRVAHTATVGSGGRDSM